MGALVRWHVCVCVINAARLQAADGRAAAQMIVMHAVRDYTAVSAGSSADPARLSLCSVSAFNGGRE